MTTLVKQCRVLDPEAGIDRIADVLIEDARVTLDPSSVPAGAKIVDGKGLWAVPGLIDLQVHFREPGFEYKETIATGSQAAFAGGVTTVVVMPNTKPTLDEPALVRAQMDTARDEGGVRLYVAAAASRGIAGKELTDHAALAQAGAVAFSDDGFPLLDDALMEQTLVDCKALDVLFMQHAEDTRMTHHVPMNLGPTSQKAGVVGQPADAEGVVVERDVRLAEKTGARYHVLHLSTKRSLDAVRAGKAKGLPVSCEASPHHLLLNDEACATLDPNTKMNPPLRSEEDRRALVQGLKDGAIDAVATDHAPHSHDEKAQGFVKAPFGVVGLETAFAAALAFVHDGTITPLRAVELMTAGPARVLRMRGKIGTLVGADAVADIALVDPARTWTVGAADLAGKSGNSCFLGRTFTGRVIATYKDGRLKYELSTQMSSG